MAKTAEEKEDEMAQAAIRAANAEAEAEEAEAENEAAEAAATGVAAANAGAALAQAEGAKAKQRAAEEIEKNQEENKWLREAVTNLHKNSEAQAQALIQTREELNSLKPLLTGIAERLTQPPLQEPEETTETVKPSKASQEKEDAQKDTGQHHQQKPLRRLM